MKERMFTNIQSSTWFY